MSTTPSTTSTWTPSRPLPSSVISKLHQTLATLRCLKFFLDWPYPHADISGPKWTGDIAEAPAADRVLIRIVGKDLDAFLLFPHKAPSVLHAMGPNGLSDRPLDQSLVFSAATFRGVTFKSMYHFDHGTFLSGHPEYLQNIANRPERHTAKGDPVTDDYFADPNYLGSGPNQPHVENVPTYWTSVNNNLLWPPKRTFAPGQNNPGAPIPDSPPPYPFRLFWERYIRYKRPSLNAFPGLGPLAGYLCAVDLHYAGHVQAPLLDDMGNIIRRINAGGVKGLIALGLLPSGKDIKHTDDTVRDAFAIYYDFLNLTVEEKTRMGFDFIMCEHSLCKITRYSNRIGSHVLVWDDHFPYSACVCCSASVLSSAP